MCCTWLMQFLELPDSNQACHKILEWKQKLSKSITLTLPKPTFLHLVIQNNFPGRSSKYDTDKIPLNFHSSTTVLQKTSRPKPKPFYIFFTIPILKYAFPSKYVLKALFITKNKKYLKKYFEAMTELHYKNKDRIKRRLHLQYPTCSILLERSKEKKFIL